MEPEEIEDDDSEYVFDPNVTVIIEVKGGVVQDTQSPNGIEPLILDLDVHPDAEITYFEEDGVQWGRVVWGEQAY